MTEAPKKEACIKCGTLTANKSRLCTECFKDGPRNPFALRKRKPESAEAQIGREKGILASWIPGYDRKKPETEEP